MHNQPVMGIANFYNISYEIGLYDIYNIDIV